MQWFVLITLKVYFSLPWDKSKYNVSQTCNILYSYFCMLMLEIPSLFVFVLKIHSSKKLADPRPPWLPVPIPHTITIMAASSLKFTGLNVMKIIQISICEWDIVSLGTVSKTFHPSNKKDNHYYPRMASWAIIQNSEFKE